MNGQPPAAPVHVSSATRPGDMNCDGSIDVGDVGPFTEALLDPAAYTASNPNCGYFFADMNGDGLVNGKDIAAFVATVMGH